MGSNFGRQHCKGYTPQTDEPVRPGIHVSRIINDRKEDRILDLVRPNFSVCCGLCIYAIFVRNSYFKWKCLLYADDTYQSDKS